MCIRDRANATVGIATTEGRAGGMNLFTSFLTLVAWVLWGCTILFVDPDVTLAPVLFYGTLFIALTCTLARLMGGGVQAEKERPTGGFLSLIHISEPTRLGMISYA